MKGQQKCGKADMVGCKVCILDYKRKWQIRGINKNTEHLLHLTSFFEPKSKAAGDEIYFE
jgi:hypothetical protein